MNDQNKKIIGWREWAQFPDWNLVGENAIKAKIDTGALYCALHADDIEVIDKKGHLFVRFRPPFSNGNGPLIEAPLQEIRSIKNSTGHVTERPVVNTLLKLGDYLIETEVTLINRDIMGFKMLIGRSAIAQFFYVDAARSYLLKKKKDLL